MNRIGERSEGTNTMKYVRNVMWMAAGVSMIACSGTSTEPSPILPREKPAVTIQPKPTMPVDHPDPSGLTVQSRGPRRMSVEQLERTLERIGGFPVGSVAIPENLALTMGKPDYLRITEESLDPSPLYMKFMVDLGGFYCTSVSDSDQLRTPTERLMNRYEGDVDRSIEHMLLMFTGIEGELGQPYLERLRRAYDTASAGPLGLVGGFQAVCLALFTAPEFILY